MRFARIDLKGYRSLVDVSLPLHSLAVMIGPNSSGKTALLEVFLLLKSGAQAKLAKALEQHGGLDAVLSKVPGAPDCLGIGLTVDVESERSREPMYYRFELAPRGVGYAISLERLEWQLDPTADTPHCYIDAQYDNVRYNDPDDPGFARTFQKLDEELALTHVPRIYGPVDLQDALSKIQLSEGTLRFLWLTAVLLSPDPSPATLIDEPEVSLHPELIKLLAGLLQDASARSQIIVATHSPDLVRWLQPQEVLVLDKLEGRTQFTWADSMDLEEWLEEYTLRDLWLMGTLLP